MCTQVKLENMPYFYFYIFFLGGGREGAEDLQRIHDLLFRICTGRSKRAHSQAPDNTRRHTLHVERAGIWPKKMFLCFMPNTSSLSGKIK